MADVFISYAHGDRAKIEKIATALEGEGFSVWWDRNIAGGAAFSAEIERALSAAKTVIVAWSVRSVQSEWVVDEASFAKQNGKLVPIRLDATNPPLGFRQYQTIDFSDIDSGAAAALLVLVQSVSRYVRRGSETAIDDLVEERAQSHYTDALAVLPLENLTGDPGQQFLVDGMHDALITDLSKIKSLKVISRTSTRIYAGTTKSIREVGAELGVSKIIEGSVLRGGDEVRINVQLIDARTDTHLWAESFDRDMTNILALQREVARAIAGHISVILTPDEKTRLADAPKVRKDSYEAYLKGMYHWYKLSPEDLQAAFEQFDAALGADPNYAPAYAGIGAAWAGVQQMGAAPTSVAAPKMKSAVDKALELDPGLFQAHFTLAVYYTWSAWNWAGAEKAFKRAIELNPNFPDTHAYFSHYLLIVGRLDESETQMERALNLDPFNPLVRSLYSVVLLALGRIDDAIRECEAVRAMSPDHWLPLQVVRLIYHAKGMEQEAVETTRALYKVLGKETVVDALDKGIAENDYRKAMGNAGDALAALAEKAFILPTQVALLYGQADETEKAVTWLEKAFEIRDPDLPYLKNLIRFPPSVMDHPRVQKIIEEFRYPDNG